MAQQFLLEGRSLDELVKEATHLYGAGARIVRAERVLDPGVAGFLGRRHLEVTVEVPDTRAAPPSPAQPAVHVLGGRSGILALLEQADRVEDDVNDPDGRESVDPVAAAVAEQAELVSTGSPGLSELLARLGGDVDAATPANGPETRHQNRRQNGHQNGPVPVPLSAAGDLVLILGLDGTAAPVAASMTTLAGLVTDGPGGYDRYGAGAPDPSGLPALAGRWEAAQARARAVETGTTVLIACTLEGGPDRVAHLEAAAALGADQVWLVVDARHKPEDTHAWVEQVRESVPVDALAVIGAAATRSPHTVNEIGVPIGWTDGRPATGRLL